MEVLGQDRGNYIPLDCLDIKDNIYLINEYGDVYSLCRNKKVSQRKDKDGYKIITLQTKEGKRRIYRIATLVAYSFIGKPPKDIIDPTIDHKDSNRTNNYYLNLRWMERGTNSSIRSVKPKGELNRQHILTEEEVLEICRLLEENELSFTEIGKMFNVKKSTISNIKRRKTWCHISCKYSFDIKKIKNKDEIKKQKEEIINMFKLGLEPKDIIKKGYAETTVRRYYKEFNSIKTGGE